MRSNGLAQIVETSENEILNEWLVKLKEAGATGAGRMSPQDLTTQCQQFLKAFKTALTSGTDINTDAYRETRAILSLTGAPGLLSERNRNIHPLSERAALQ